MDDVRTSREAREFKLCGGDGSNPWECIGPGLSLLSRRQRMNDVTDRIGLDPSRDGFTTTAANLINVVRAIFGTGPVPKKS